MDKPAASQGTRQIRNRYVANESGKMDGLMTVSVEPDRNKNRALADILLTAEHPDCSTASVRSADY